MEECLPVVLSAQDQVFWGTWNDAINQAEKSDAFMNKDSCTAETILLNIRDVCGRILGENAEQHTKVGSPFVFIENLKLLQNKINDMLSQSDLNSTSLVNFNISEKVQECVYQMYQKSRKKMCDSARQRRKKRKHDSEHTELSVYEQVYMLEKRASSLRKKLEKCQCVVEESEHPQCISLYDEDLTMTGFKSKKRYFEVLCSKEDCVLVQNKIKWMLQIDNRVLNAETLMSFMLCSALNVEMACGDVRDQSDCNKLHCAIVAFAKWQANMRTLCIQQNGRFTPFTQFLLVITGKITCSPNDLPTILQHARRLFLQTQELVYSNYVSSGSGVFYDQHNNKIKSCKVLELCNHCERENEDCCFLFDTSRGKYKAYVGQSSIIQSSRGFALLKNEKSGSTLRLMSQNASECLLPSAKCLLVPGRYAKKILRIMNLYRTIASRAYAIIKKCAWSQLFNITGNVPFHIREFCTFVRKRIKMAVSMDNHCLLIFNDGDKEKNYEDSVVEWIVEVAQNSVSDNMLGAMSRCTLSVKPQKGGRFHSSKKFATEFNSLCQRNALTGDNESSLTRKEFQSRLYSCIEQAVENTLVAANGKKPCYVAILSDFDNFILGIVLFFIAPWQDQSYKNYGDFPSQEFFNGSKCLGNICALLDEDSLLSMSDVNVDTRSHRLYGASIDRMAIGAGSTVRYRVSFYSTVVAKVKVIHLETDKDSSTKICLQHEPDKGSVSTLIVTQGKTINRLENFVVACVLTVGTCIAQIITTKDLLRRLNMEEYKEAANIFRDGSGPNFKGFGSYEKIVSVSISYTLGGIVQEVEVDDLGKLAPAF